MNQSLGLVSRCRLIIASGLAVRLAVAWFSIGTNDADAWRAFADSIDRHGLFESYWRYPSLNHPPLAALWSSAALRLARGSGVSFELLFKLPAILADAATCLLLAMIWTRRRDARTGWLAAAIFAISPVAILIGAYHCNTDNIYAMLCLLAAYLLDRRRFLAAGLSLAVAINIKLIPVLLILPLLSLTRDRREALRFLTGLAVGVVPFIPVLLGAGEHFVRNVLGYAPQGNRWGVAFALYELHLHESTRRFALDAMRLYFENGRHLIFAAVAIASLFCFTRRRWNAFELSALTFAMFLVLTPGFGVQYLVIVAPLILAAGIGWGVAYGLVAGLFALLVYWQTWTGTVPLYSFFDGPFPLTAAVVGIAVWGMLAGYVVREVAGWRRGKPR